MLGRGIRGIRRSWLCLEYFCPKDVNLDLIFRLLKNSSDISLHRTIRIDCQKKKKKNTKRIITGNNQWKLETILRIINRTKNSPRRISNVFFFSFFLSFFFDARMLNRALPSRATCSSIHRE